MKNLKKIDNDIIFKIAIFLLPFENFFFAPSSGWATLTPIILFVYILLNLKEMITCIKKHKKILIFFIIGILLSFIDYIFAGYNFKNTINSLIPLGLGFTIFCSFDIYYSKNRTINKLIKPLCIAYSLSLIIGIIEFITIKGNIRFLYEFFDLIFKRNYLELDRIQFFFTEPSFIGMHLFGVLLPIYFISKNKRIMYLIIAFGISSIIFSSGVRILLDICVVGVILLVYYLISRKKYKLLLLIPVVFIASILFLYNSNYRVKQIIDNGIYADGSLATRYFRIQSTVYGYVEDPVQTIFGYGLGNSIVPLRAGYDKAIKTYKSTYLDEVIGLGDQNFSDDSVSYCLYTRFISEFGIIMFIIAIVYVLKITKNSEFKYKYPYLLITLYLYIQFESYAFYSLWLFILVMLYTKRTLKIKTNILVGYVEDGVNSGIDKYLLNFLNSIKLKERKMDFLTKKYSEIMEKELKDYGCNLYKVSQNRHPIKQFMEMRKIIKKGNYGVAYFNISETFNCIGIIAAKVYGIDKIVVHSHSSGSDKNSKLKRNICEVLNYICKPIVHICTDKKLACSTLAAKWLYCKSIVSKNRFELIYNAIDTKKFTPNSSNRNKIRKKYNLGNELVVGHVGRFCYQKNHKFLIDIFSEVLEIDKKAKLICIGSGELFDETKNYAKEKGIIENIIFTGVVDNVNEYMQSFDIFILPSRFEGLPIVGIEAQFSGLPCLFSNNISEEVIISENSELVEISNPKEWANKICENYKKSNKMLVVANNYKLESIKKQFESIIEM